MCFDFDLPTFGLCWHFNDLKLVQQNTGAFADIKLHYISNFER